ncbi:MAG: glycoside hydrolase [Pyrinomonadaceae bacterium]
MIGPFRGGRTVGATGVPGQPNVFYIGVNNGGVWKTTDAGRVWFPIFDDQPTGSIGALAVAPSDPNVVYVGSGEGLQRPDLSTGDGMYKSTDAGKTWTHLGMREVQQIGAIIVDPRDANRIFVAALGHPYGANEERGVYRSDDGGQNFRLAFHMDENTGAIALCFDPKNPDIIYADLWAGRQGPWENGAWQGPNSGLFKSTDGGFKWRQLTKGLPTTAQGLGRIGMTVAPSDPNRLYATVDAGKLGGIYRSDDAGESWRMMNPDPRLWGRGSDFAEVKVDPKNPDIVYSANVATHKSTDGGKTWTSWRGAPGGDDYHTIWINPDNPDVILIASDQGAIITVNGGKTFSSWYNQPTAQFYHVITDNQYPYWVYGGQQESGSVGTTSRGDNGVITFRDWRTVGAEEYGYVAPDPLDSNIIYGGKLTRFDKRTGQAQNIAPEAVRSGKYRFLRTAPVIFSPVDPHVLYYAGNVLFRTTTGGQSWEVISPDLSNEKPDVPDSIGFYKKPEMATQPRRGVIYALAPSPQDVNTIWAGTDDGLIHVTRDGGKNWSNITPTGLTSWSKVSQLDASHFDANTAYAAINRIRLDDQRPHIYRTHDGGTTWQEIVRGLPDNAPVNTVREDPVRKGLLVCGTENAVYFSLNDGDDWLPLRLNMPATSIRDLVIHGDDVVVGTHGRSFWILDDITPLRQLNADVVKSDAFLFAPQLATRVRRNVNTDTPLPQEEPAGQNPPDGAIINYYLKSGAHGPVEIVITGLDGRLVRRFTSEDHPVGAKAEEINPPTYWIRPARVPSARAGMQRFIWNLQYAPPPPVDKYDLPISAIYGDTPPVPEGPYVLPGIYKVKLIANGNSYEQTLTVRMDPRVVTPAEGLAAQWRSSLDAYDGAFSSREIVDQIHALRAEIADRLKNASAAEVKTSLAVFDQKLGDLETGSSTLPASGASPVMTFSRVIGSFITVLDVLQVADAAPTTQAAKALGETINSFEELRTRWMELLRSDFPAVNETLRNAGQPPLTPVGITIVRRSRGNGF